jgi:hypothetical protein
MESFIDTQIIEHFKAISGKKEEVIKNALVANGFNPTNHQFLTDNFELIIKEGDKYEHLYYHFGKADQKRIISILNQPEVEFGNENGTYKAISTYRYY